MTTPTIPALLSSDDLDSFNTSDPDWFLNAAGEIIRGFCQWHIAPSLTVTETLPIQPEGSIMLRSLYVTGVASVVIDGLEVDPSTYYWHQAGYIRRSNAQQFFEWPLWPLESDTPFREYPSAVARHATVTYTHGYPTLPAQVAAVGLQLCQQAIELPSAAATSITAGPQSITFGGTIGLVLSTVQRRLLGPYRWVGF